MSRIMVQSNNSFRLKDELYESYINFVDQNSSESCLFFILQRSDRVYWKNRLGDRFSSNILSYFSFIQQEIKRYWNLLSENFEYKSEPVFLTFESSQTLMVKLIEFFREKNMLQEIAFSNEELAQKMLSNLYNLATGNNSYSKFSNLIKNQNFIGKLSDETYKQLEKLLEIYLNRSLKIGVFDYPSCLYIYNNYLLQNSSYIKSLERFQMVLVDEYSCQIPCLNLFLSHIKSIVLYDNPWGAYGIYYPNSKKESGFIENFLTITKNEKSSFLKEFYGSLFYDKKPEFNSENVLCKGNFSNEKEINKYIEEIIDKECHKENKSLLILSPNRNDSLLENLKKYCNKNEIPFLNLDKNEKFLDNPYIYALVSFGIIYFDYGKVYLNEDEIRQILALIFNIEIFEACVLAKKIPYNKTLFKILRDKNIKNFLFFEGLFLKNFDTVSDFYLELLSKKELLSRELALALEKIYDFSLTFSKNISNFDNIKDKNLEFFLALRKGIKESETIGEIRNKIDFNGVMMGTPNSFLRLSKKTHITVFVDLENNLWNMNFINPVQNPFLLNGSVQKKIYDSEMDNYFKREELFNLISKILFSTSESLMFLGNEGFSTSILKRSLF